MNSRPGAEEQYAGSDLTQGGRATDSVYKTRHQWSNKLGHSRRFCHIKPPSYNPRQHVPFHPQDRPSRGLCHRPRPSRLWQWQDDPLLGLLQALLRMAWKGGSQFPSRHV